LPFDLADEPVGAALARDEFAAPSSRLAVDAQEIVAGGILAVMYIAARRVVTATAASAVLPPRSADRGLFMRVLRAERWRIRRGGGS